MSTVGRDYQRFVRWLAKTDAADDVKCLSNIVQNDLDTLIPLGTAGRRRSKSLAATATRIFERTSSQLNEEENGEQGELRRWSKLSTLKVGPFRGFVVEETFDLSKNITLVYGANGAGKSSLCEALEFGLLGEVSEAEVKRIQGAAYYQNAWAQKFTPPTVSALLADGTTVSVTPNEETFRFCFVEKNRIDSFSRLASRVPAEKSKLIATLFGIDQFAEFVRGFNDEIDPQLDLVGVKTTQLAQARTSLQTAETLVKSEFDRVKGHEDTEIALAAEFGCELSYHELKAHLGSQEAPGRIECIRARLEAAPLIVVGVTREDLEQKLEKVRASAKSLQLVDAELQARASEISFQQLYTAVSSLEGQMPEKCPACDTTLNGPHPAHTNPYEKARASLANLVELAALQTKQHAFKLDVDAESRQVHDALTKLRTQLDSVGVAVPKLEPLDSWWTALLEDGARMWGVVLEQASAVEKLDADARTDARDRALLSDERDRLNEFDRRIIAQDGARAEWSKQLREARELIARFEIDNKELIQEAEAEKPAVKIQVRIKEAYDEFLSLIKQYLSALPASLLADLGESARNLYNAFNREDRPGDLLANLWLPTTPEGKIEISFHGTPDARRDALQILSEGHIRCLGLALLVAKNIKLQCPVLVFDDAVNAIDDDHRDAIWRTLFEDKWLDDKQVVLTCHGQEFIKVIQQGLGAKRVKEECNYYELLPHDGNHHPIVDTVPKSKNYVLNAQTYLARQDSRNALSESRRALEGIAQRLWKWLGKLTPTPVQLTFRAPGTKAELRNLCEQLKKSLEKQSFQHDKKPLLTAAMSTLLGVDGASVEWQSLNSGTHEDDHPEFNRATVAQIVNAVSELDGLLSP